MWHPSRASLSQAQMKKVPPQYRFMSFLGLRVPTHFANQTMFNNKHPNKPALAVAAQRHGSTEFNAAPTAFLGLQPRLKPQKLHFRVCVCVCTGCLLTLLHDTCFTQSCFWKLRP